MLELLVIVLLSGQEAHVNPRHIVSMVEAKDADDPGKHYTADVRCVITTIDGKNLSTREECDAIEIRIREIVEKRMKEIRK
ncbi:MAG TPA: hypothetical protein VH593_10470 [Ktedonobacteraceae bacterium]|jgi:uncharacterized protein YlzI (FlbEa/FlbD family)